MEQNSLFIELLQHSISPIALISGVGLILLSVSNRLGRTIDRTRHLVLELEKGESYITPRIKEKKIEQLQILHIRNKLLRNSIAGISLSILASSLLIPVLIIDFFLNINVQQLGIVIFSASICGIIISAIFLFRDVSLTLKAIEKEAEDYL